jgi:excisionase family DNA binding protein
MNRQTSWLEDHPTASAPPPRTEVRPVALPVASTDPELMTAARYLGVSRWTVQRLRRDGELVGFRIGAAAMITTDSLDAYVARQLERTRDGG